MGCDQQQQQDQTTAIGTVQQQQQQQQQSEGPVQSNERGCQRQQGTAVQPNSKCGPNNTASVTATATVTAPRPAQYIVVSHRPEVFEKAGCLVGVYSLGGSSRAVVARCGGAGAGA